MANLSVKGQIGSFAFEKLAVDGSTALTASVYHVKSTTNALNKIAQFATITVETDQVRYRLDGTAPDSTTGHLLNVGDALYLESADDIRKFLAIKVTSSAVIQVSYA